MSRQLKEHEKNYPTHDLELAAVVFFIKNLVSLSVWSALSNLHRPQEFKVPVHSEGIEYEAAAMARTGERI